MITREQVTNIIADALKSPNDIATDQAHEFAQRLATALDALGLIQFCDIAEPEDEHTTAQPPGGFAEHVERRDRSSDAYLGTRSSRDHTAVPLAQAEQRQQSQADTPRPIPDTPARSTG